jgi:hypothetical protein
MRLRGPGPAFLAVYQDVLFAYLISILFLYPYGVTVLEVASFRPPDLFALAALALGIGAVLAGGRVRITRAVFVVAGAFVLLELAAPVIGAVGYRRFGDVVSALRMAMLWLPMVLLTMLAPPTVALQFEDRL